MFRPSLPFPFSPGHAAVVLSPVQMDTTLLDVCTPCYMLLYVVGICCTKFETCQTFSYVQMLGLFANNLMLS